MSLQIEWQAAIAGSSTQVRVPILEAELILTMIGETIVDASWSVRKKHLANTLSTKAIKIQRYLLNPNTESLQVVLQKQGSVYSNTVWNDLLAIPVGQVMSYSALAEKLGSGARAVARACRDNPYAGLIPCHRVVAKSGIGGFMGQSHGEFVELKRQLLAYEHNIAQQIP